MIEPVDGELDYVSARKNPVKFCNKLANRAVISHQLKNISPRKLHLNSTVKSLKSEFSSESLQMVETKLIDVLKSRTKLKNFDWSSVMRDPHV